LFVEYALVKFIASLFYLQFSVGSVNFANMLIQILECMSVCM